MRSTWLRILGGSMTLMAVTTCSGRGNDDDTLPPTSNDDDDAVTTPDEDDDTTPTDDDDTTQPETIERVLTLGEGIRFIWNEAENAPLDPSIALVDGHPAAWDEERQSLLLAPMVEGRPSGLTFPLGARWEITPNASYRPALDELLSNAMAEIKSDSVETLADTWDGENRFVIPVEHFTSFAVLLSGGALEKAVGNGNEDVLVFLTALGNGGAQWAIDIVLGVTCGNGVVNPFETCDGDETCTKGCYDGTRTCSTDCLTLSEECVTGGQQCGNGLVEGCEVCDTNIQPCSNGCYAGTQACLGDCAGYATECATGDQACGNGVVEGCEVCDAGTDNGKPEHCSSDCTGIAPVTCGNGVVDPGEACDSAISDPCMDEPLQYKGLVTCNASCTTSLGCVLSEHCGDGSVNGLESCDEATLNGLENHCASDCAGLTPSICGNFVREAAEECDSGGVDDTACNFDCTRVECGDEYPNYAAGEACDSGAVDTHNCDRDCSLPECGDGYLNTQTYETCDDGPGGSCFDDCTGFNVCGDGKVFQSEDCDTSGVDAADCDFDCTFVMCPDGHLNAVAGEVCDSGGVDAANCDADCTVPACGDGHANLAAGEACDSGGVDTAFCDFDCTLPKCRDGHLNTASGEVCDTGGTTSACDGDCTLPKCGDAFWNSAAGEECDGGSANTVSCDEDCTFPTCGDGLLNPMANEACDDGNLTAGDGCSSVCLVESACMSTPAIVGQYDTYGNAINLAIDGPFAYVADEQSAVVMVNISNSSSPILNQSIYLGLGTARNVKASYPFVYAWTRVDSYKFRYDEKNVSSNPPSSVFSQVVYGGNWGYNSDTLTITSGFAYTACITNDYMGVNTAIGRYDILPPTLPSSGGGHSIWGSGSDLRDLVVEGSRLYQVGGIRGLPLIVLDLNTLSQIGEYQSPEYKNGLGMAIRGNVGFLANTCPTLDILDMTSVNPSRMATYPATINCVTNRTAYGVALSGDYAYLAEGTTGVEVIDISDPFSPTSVMTIDTPGFANDIVVSGQYAYVADGPAGLVIIGGLPGCHTCGNTVVENGEACDDGNLTPGDGCNDTCTGP